MATNISYGQYSFPHPYPFLAIEHEPVIISGVLDHSIIKASLIGEFTGCNFKLLKQQKDAIISALSTGFQTLIVGDSTYEYAKPVSINFSNSNIRNRLPYSIEFSIQNEKSFSKFYGIKDPQDSWSYSENEDRTVSATHVVSAFGVKITGDSFQNAKNFVNSRLSGFNNSLFVYSGHSPVLVSKNEEINRASNFYSVSENWKYSISPNTYDKPDSIVRPNCSINYNSDGSLTVSVQGVIEGGISGSANSGFFTKEQATEFAKNSLYESKSNTEFQLYGEIFKEPIRYSYEYDEGSNLVNFNYEFGDSTDPSLDEVTHKYRTSINASKDSTLISVSVNGEVFFNKITNPNIGDDPEQEYRFQKVNEYFNKIDPLALAFEGYNFFNQGNTGYSKLKLNRSTENFNITKNPFESSIQYDYTYDTSIDFFSGILLNPSVSINTQLEYLKYGVNPTIDDSFAVQNLYISNKRVSVSVDGEINTGYGLQTALNIISGYIRRFSTPNGFLISDDISSGDGKISVNKTFFFR
jgi:hypothetical protein